ncbi:retrovirus-related pol polyprotein from transposon TNT 1-94 [Tanacetum coccineum]
MEFLNKTLHAYFKEEGIEHQTSTPRTPKQNGVVERRNRTLVEAARTMLSASKASIIQILAKAVATSCLYSEQIIHHIPHGREGISHHHDSSRSYRTKASYCYNSDPVPPRQNVVPIAEKTDSSQQGLEFLFSPLLEEYYNPTHGLAEENNNDQAPNASFQEAEFINPFFVHGRNFIWFTDLKVWELIEQTNLVKRLRLCLRKKVLNFEESLHQLLRLESSSDFPVPRSTQVLPNLSDGCKKRHFLWSLKEEVSVAQTRRVL